MVLTLKRWKSRSSPGIAAGGAGKPIHSFNKAAAGRKPRGGFFVSGQFCLEAWSSARKGRKADRPPAAAIGREEPSRRKPVPAPEANKVTRGGAVR